MINGIRTINPCGLNKVFDSKFHVGSQIWQETPEKSLRTHWRKSCEYNRKDEDNNPNTPNGKNYQDLSQKFRKTIYIYIYIYIYTGFGIK